MDKARVALPELASAVAAAKAELGTSGRVLVRPSGTEPTVRVMVEAVDAEQAQRTADSLAAAVRAAGLTPPLPFGSVAPNQAAKIRTDQRHSRVIHRTGF